VFRDEAARVRYQAWLTQMSERLKRKLPDAESRLEFLQVAWYESNRAGLDPGLVLGLIQVESAYRKYAVSMAGARGYMQVMPFWTGVIGDSNRSALFQMQTNLRYGCAILRMYVDMEAGNLYLALGRYNGSRGRPEYPNAVLAAWNNWRFSN
jgi:soluble lytic murein transglycosylase-like protein